MADRLVINTGPLIVLARVELLDIVGRIPIEIICPHEVRQEIEAGVELGYPNVEPEWLRTIPLATRLNPVATASLDVGEAAVIQLALEQNVPRVCIDERKGRHAAVAVGLKITGTLGLLARAKQLGIIPALRPQIEKLKDFGAYFDEELVRRVLEGVGE